MANIFNRNHLLVTGRKKNDITFLRSRIEITIEERHRIDQSLEHKILATNKLSTQNKDRK